MTKRSFFCCCVILSVSLAGEFGRCAADDLSVTVRTDGGLIFTAAVDETTNEHYLTLRFDGKTASIARSIPWRSVAHVHYDGRNYTSNEFRGVASGLGTRRPRATSTAATVSDGARTTSERQNDIADSKIPAQLPYYVHTMIGAIVADAYVAHWDADTEVDGLVLLITAVDKYGISIPVRGTLTAELISDRRNLAKPQLRTRREKFNRIGYWTRNVMTHGDGEAVFLLPFQAIHPEFNTRVDGSGVLHVKLAVPGQGVFSTSVTDVRIRPISRYRDRIQNSLGKRFLNIERTGRGSRSSDR